MTHVVDALKRRRKALRPDSDEGFTLIELLVVVIIIGILAAIAIPVYLGVQNNAKDASVQSDVGNLKTAAVSVQTTTNAPLATSKTPYASAAALTAAMTQAGATFGNATTSLTYYPSAAGFCLLGISKTGNSFAATDSQGVQKGSCTTGGAFSTTVVTTAP